MRVLCLPVHSLHRFLFECADLILLRQQYFNAASLSDSFLDVDVQTTLAFLKASDLFPYVPFVSLICDHDL